MIRHLTPVAILVSSLAHPVAAAERESQEVRGAIAKALPLIQKGSAGHRTQRTCFACHHQAIPMLAVTSARTRGLAVAEDEVPKHLRFIVEFLDKNRDNYLQGRGQGGQVDTAGYALWTLEMGGWKPDDTTEAVVEYLLLRDKDDDHWAATSDRPPSEASSFTSTYLAVRALQTFGRASQTGRIGDRLRRVRAWLAKTPGKETEDRVFRLWALKRLGCDSKLVQAAAQELVQSQGPDGGWAQLPMMESDAYATGSALVALREAAGMTPEETVYRRGMKFLLTTQREDGTWYVHSRSKPFQTYFESGFPHGPDQFISLAASSWATTALVLSLPAEKR
jgi:hypothetical protein